MRDAKDIAILGGASLAESAALIGGCLMGGRYHWPMAVATVGTVALNSLAIYQYDDQAHWAEKFGKSITNLYDLGLFLLAYKVLKSYGQGSQVGPLAVGLYGLWVLWRVVDIVCFNSLDGDEEYIFMTDRLALSVVDRLRRCTHGR